MAYDTIKYEVAEQILTITLNRPDKLNAFNATMQQELIDAFDKADARDDSGNGINGVGYRAQADAKNLKLQLGFSHDVEVPIPTGIQIKALKPTEIEITGSDRQKVGQLAAEIRSLRPPEPYKGKGIKYSTETVRRKEGKKK